MIRAFDLLPWNRHKRWRRDVSAVLDGALSTPERERLQAHLATCDGCRDFDRDLRATQASLASLRDVEAPRSFRLTPAMVAAPARPPERARSSALMRGAQLATALAVIGLAVVSIVDFSDSGTKHSANSTTSLAAAAPQGAKSAPLNDAAGGAGFGSAPEDNHAPQPAGTTAPATPTGGNVVVPTPRGPNSAGTGCDAAQPLSPNSPATTSPPTPCASPSSAEATSKAGTAPPAETPAPNDSAPTQRQQSNTAEPAIAPATTATTTAKAGWYRPAELGLGIVAAIAAVAVIVLAFRTREP